MTDSLYFLFWQLFNFHALSTSSYHMDQQALYTVKANAMRSLLRERSPQARIFISGTYDDLRPYRNEVAEGIEASGNLAIEPHDTTGPTEKIAARIERQITQESEGFFGFYGPRYGSLMFKEDAESLSYSEYEYDLAVATLRSSKSMVPIFLMSPKKGGSLRDEIDKCVAAIYRGMSDFDASCDWHRQAKFLKRITEEKVDERTYEKSLLLPETLEDIRPLVESALRAYFDNILDLKLRASAADVTSATLDRPISTRRPVEALPCPTPVEKAQQLCHTYSRHGARASPLMCILIHGPRDSARSLSDCVEHIASNIIPWEYEYTDRASFDPEERCFGSAAEVAWSALGMALPPTGPEDISELARALVDGEARMVLRLHAMNHYPGQFVTFVRSFLQPLSQELSRRLANTTNPGNVLTLVLGHYGNLRSEQPDAQLALTYPAENTEVDFTKICVLRLLGQQNS